MSVAAVAVPICRRLLRQTARLAASRALFSAGSSSEMSTAMMPMTTNSSTRVNALRPVRLRVKRIIADLRELTAQALRPPTAVGENGGVRQQSFLTRTLWRAPQQHHG